MQPPDLGTPCREPEKSVPAEGGEHAVAEMVLGPFAEQKDLVCRGDTLHIKF